MRLAKKIQEHIFCYYIILGESSLRIFLHHQETSSSNSLTKWNNSNCIFMIMKKKREEDYLKYIKYNVNWDVVKSVSTSEKKS